MKYTIRYQYGTYSGERVIFAEDGESAIAKMWGDMKRRNLLTLPMAHQSAVIVSEEEEDDDGSC